MRTKISGTIMPVVQIGLEPGERIISEPGAFSWMSANVQLSTSAFTAGATSLWGVVGRALSGGGIFMNEYASVGGTGLVAFAAKAPGSIMEVSVAPGQALMIHRHGFLCATAGAQLSIGFQRSLGAGIFGGEGLILQKLEGLCTAWIGLGGEVVPYDLAPGETLQVHPGHIGMFESSVNFDVGFMPGLKNALFGGDGLFIARLTGPGRVWLQSLTLPNLAHVIAPYLEKESVTVSNTPFTPAGLGVGVVAGSLLRGLFDD